MRTSRPTLNGKIRAVFGKIVPAALLLTGMLVPGAGRAQVYSCRFHYQEQVIADYSSVLSGGNVKQKRQDQLLHAGTMQITALNDSVLHIKMRTDSFAATMNGITMPAQLSFNAYTDKSYRVYKVSTAVDNKLFLSVLPVWLGEMHFKCPAPGATTEAKPDGDLHVTYHRSAKGKDTIGLTKDQAYYVAKTNNRQVLLVNDYTWEGYFSSQTQSPHAIHFSEQKKQILGRKVLACIQRELVVDRIAGQASGPGIDTSGYQMVYLYPRLTDKERRESLAASLLGTEDISTIAHKLQQAETLGNEQRFRLKSLLRSLLITDSTSVTAILNLPGANQQGSAAFDIIENAIIESRTSAGDAYISKALETNENNYERLKELLIKISLAETFSRTTAGQLLNLLQKKTDPDTRSMVSLALSNYAVTIKDDTAFYRQIINELLHPHQNIISDTLQYIYLAGNAGIAPETERLIQIANSSHYRAEALFALRNIHNTTADKAIQSYLLAYRGNEDVFAALLAKKEVPVSFWKELEKNSVNADARKDSTALPALRYLLDNAWQRNIDVRPLLAHKFQMEAYKQEIEDFRKQSSLCE